MAQSNNLAFIEQTAGTVGNTAYQEQAAGSNGNQGPRLSAGLGVELGNSPDPEWLRTTTRWRPRTAMGSNNRITQSQTGTNLKATAPPDRWPPQQPDQPDPGWVPRTPPSAYQGGGSGNTTIHDQSGNGGDTNFNTANSYMTNQTNSQQYVTQSAGMNNATQQMLSAGGGNFQQIVQNSQAEPRRKFCR